MKSRTTETSITEEKTDEQSELEEFPLTKSLGYSINKNLDQIKKMMGNDRLNQEYAEQYFDMMRISRETFEKFDDEEETRPKRAGSNTLIAKHGIPDRRRSASHFPSAAGQRRQRSQATRREKLKSQGLKSHLLHTKHVLDYDDESHL
ncbi:hypothetical protein K1T71_011209 [Dendrolimus kikuchii]|uniref:Uncharacterized protein n=1 Tax=Dendrolimus kikuchii TaxID=765133 RepID=A0ACC1CN71_9NEOP|nr:hypothetical protein K1T71_011209 [Dendrolimus kikuchii]